MILIFIKIIICSSLLIALYYAFLEKEKMYQFNRFFLLVSLVLACIAPLVTINTKSPNPAEKSGIVFGKVTQQVLDISQKQENFNLMNIVYIVYGSITFILLIKTVYSIIRINRVKGKKIKYQNYNVIITKDHLSPFTFWKTIYLGEHYMVDNTLDSRIFLHEKSHLEQKHSVDLLFIEFLKVLMWLNPALYFYKKAIINNHEFLADEAVLKHHFNVKEYQELILDEILSGQNYNLIHTFNFNNIKKRFIMMNRKKSKRVGLKKVSCIPVLVAVFGLFVQKTYANKPQDGNQWINKNTDLETIRPKSKNTPQEEVAKMEFTENIIEPVYPGGKNELRSKFANTFDSSKLGSNKNIVKTDLEFVINEDGKVEDLKATGDNENFNNEAKASFLRVNENVKWQPATKDGVAVRYTMRMPLTMKFE